MLTTTVHIQRELCSKFEQFLQAKHATANNSSWGVDGETGKVVDMKDYGIWEPFAVKVQTYKTAIEVRTKFNFPCYSKLYLSTIF